MGIQGPKDMKFWLDVSIRHSVSTVVLTDRNTTSY